VTKNQRVTQVEAQIGSQFLAVKKDSMRESKRETTGERAAMSAKRVSVVENAN
jgi:hypothetical protein